jgi:hypothetical protein
MCSARDANGVSHQGVLDHPEIHAVDPRLSAQLGQGRNWQAAVFGHHDGLRLANLGRHFRDDCLLLFEIETQGLPPFIKSRHGANRARRTRGDLSQATSLNRGTICVGFRGQRSGIRDQ